MTIAGSDSPDEAAEIDGVFESIFRGEEVNPNLQAALLFAEKIGANERSGVQRGALHITLRTIETYILSHVEIRKLSTYWDSLLGRQREDLAISLEKILGVNASENLVAYVFDRIEASSANTHQAKVTDAVIESVLDDIWSDGRKELRCSLCGYHFRAADIGNKRIDVVQEIGFSLSANIQSRRLSDVLKPTYRPAKKNKDDLSYTIMHVDHVVPRAGFGASRRNNLQVVCGLCNWGKGCYRFPLECISSAVALSITTAASDTNWSALEDMFVAALRMHARCVETGLSATETELTVRPIAKSSLAPTWYVPWNYETVSYDVYDPA